MFAQSMVVVCSWQTEVRNGTLRMSQPPVASLHGAKFASEI